MSKAANITIAYGPNARICKRFVEGPVNLCGATDAGVRMRILQAADLRPSDLPHWAEWTENGRRVGMDWDVAR